MFKNILLFTIGLYCITSYSFAQNTNLTFRSFTQSNYGLNISKDFSNVNKYCKTSQIFRGLKISISGCDKRIRNFIQESYDTIYNGNTNNLGAELSTVYITLNNILNNENNNISGYSQTQKIKDQRNIINSIIKGNPSKTKMTIDQNIAIQIASLEIILNDYLINNNKKSNIVINPSNNNNTDCKDDYNCFIEKSKTCSQAKMQIDRISNFFGVIGTTTMYYEIKELKNNKCDFYINTIKSKISYSSGYIQTLLDEGITINEINKEIEESNKTQKALEGLDGTCSLSTTYLTKILNERKTGTLNNKQLTSEFCSGKLFPKNNMTFNLSNKN